MDVEKAIFERRSIRKYESDPIAPDLIRKILDAGTMAPSGINLQPWYFVAVTGEEALRELTSIMKTAAERTEPTLRERFPDNPEVVEESTKFIWSLGGAPLVVMSFLYRPDYGERRNTMIQSVAAATQNMLLAAWSLGIGSCWLTAPVETGVDKDLQARFAPGKGELVNMATFGYPARIPKAPPRKENRISLGGA
ncbi:MAG: nitroreductase family protein [Clostridiales Family XIII bacterium]|jgi:nitroreductase|nr:nitroreductase family protein [Clostridiales Family XIII bacterium]